MQQGKISLDSPLISIKAADQVHPELKLSQNKLESTYAIKISCTDNLAIKLELKYAAKS